MIRLEYHYDREDGVEEEERIGDKPLLSIDLYRLKIIGGPTVLISFVEVAADQNTKNVPRMIPKALLDEWPDYFRDMTAAINDNTTIGMSE